MEALFYIIICAKIRPQTHGSPNAPLPTTVYQLSGTKTPVNFCVRFITAIAEKPSSAFMITDLKKVWLFICKTNSAKPQTDSQIIARIPTIFKISPT